MGGDKGLKHEVVPVPQNKGEAVRYMRQIARAQREIDKINTKLNEDVEKLTEKATERIAPHQQEIDDLVDGLYIYASANRNALTDGGKKKTISWPTGKFGWRFTPPKVALKKVADVLAALKEKGLERFIRVKESVNKEALLEEPEVAQTIKGVSVTQHEEFFVRPLKLEIDYTVKPKK